MNYHYILRRALEKTLTQSSVDPCLPPVNTPRPVPYTEEWGNEQMKCCKCLVYGETECGDQGCAECVAWVMRNRRKNQQSSNWSDSPCGQALNKPQFSGGSGSSKFDNCWCGTSDTGSSTSKCLKQADTACKRVGGGYFDTGTGSNPKDPTGGANYYHRCDLDNGHTRDMECNVKAGICRKVTTGACASCDHCFFVCDSMPKPCEDFEDSYEDDSYEDGSYEYDSGYD